MVEEILRIAQKKLSASTDEVVELLARVRKYSDTLWTEQGRDASTIRAIHTKFNDAGRRSAPWRAFSKKTPGRPQDGADGNRTNRWLLPTDHKFYATEKVATLVQIRYYLQALSMQEAPDSTPSEFQTAFDWLTGHRVFPGEYLDPIQLKCISLDGFFKDPSSITSGHLIPLDRDGKHEPANTFLMLKQSNDLQGNLTLDELLELMREIVRRHSSKKPTGSQ